MRNIIIAALLSTTAIVTPSEASAAPVAAFLIGAVAPGLGASAIGASIVSASALAQSAFVLGATSLFGSISGSIIISIATSALLRTLNPIKGPSSGSSEVQRLTNFKQGVSYMTTVYGETRVGGPFGFTGFNNDIRYYNILLASHECNGVVQHYLDERAVTIDGSGEVTTSPIDPYGNLVTYLGSSGQVAPPNLVSAFPEVTPEFDFKGLTHTVIEARKPAQDKFQDVYPRSREWVYTALIEGKNNIFDPRDNTSKYTDNAALVIADWIVNSLGQSVDWDEVAQEADQSDILVTNKEGGTQPKWTLNGKLSDDQDLEEQRSLLAVSCDSFFYERTDGKVGFHVGRWVEPTVTLVDQDFYSLDFTDGSSQVDTPSEVSVIYTEPDIDYREQASAPYVIRADERKRVDQPQLPFVTTHNQAARLNKRLALVQNPSSELRGQIGVIGYELIGQRFIKVDHQGLGISNDYYEIVELSRTEQLGVFEFSAVQVQQSDFDFDASTEEGDKPLRNNPTNVNTVPEFANVSPTSSGNGTITVVLTYPPDIEADAYTPEVQVEVAGGGDPLLFTSSGQGETVIVCSGLTDGDTYNVRARMRSAANRVGNFSADQSITVVNNPAAPSDLTAISGLGGSGQATVTFTTSNDSNQASVGIFRNTTNDFGTSSFVARVFAGANTTDSFTDTSLSAGTYYYWGVPANSSGIGGNESSTGAVTVT